MSVRGNTSFWRNAQGNLTITTSVVGLMLATAVGAALDGSRLFTTHQSLQSITDAAALAAAMPERASNAKREGIAEGTIQKHSDQLKKFEKVSETINVIGTGEQVRVTLSAEVPLLFAGVLGAESRRVSATSLAEETSGSSMSAMSLSVVLDLSSSMAERFDSGSKSAAVRAALSDLLKRLEGSMGGEGLADLNLSTGLYGFNWGAVNGETVELEPGATNVLDALVNLSLDEGSVPAPAIEAALEDHVEEKKGMGGRDRFLVYITDGDIDDEKADQKGRYLNASQQMGGKNVGQCNGALNQLEQRSRKMVDAYNEASLLWRILGLQPRVNVNDPDFIQVIDEMIEKRADGTGWRDANGRPVDHPAVDRVEDWRVKYQTALDRVEDVCEYEQTTRVLDACETARMEEDISIIAVNMSPDDMETKETTWSCVFGKEKNKKDVKRSNDKQSMQTDVTKTKRLPNGLMIELSDDEKSIYAEVESLEDLRHVLASMLPDGTAHRSVRLVK